MNQGLGFRDLMYSRQLLHPKPIILNPKPIPEANHFPPLCRLAGKVHRPVSEEPLRLLEIYYLGFRVQGLEFTVSQLTKAGVASLSVTLSAVDTLVRTANVCHYKTESLFKETTNPYDS